MDFFSSWREQGLLFSCNVQASYCEGFSCGARGLHSTGSILGALKLSRFTACGILPDQGSNLFPALAGGFFTTEPAGKPYPHFKDEKLQFMDIGLKCIG